jgi:hypothetical protein
MVVVLEMYDAVCAVCLLTLCREKRARALIIDHCSLRIIGHYSYQQRLIRMSACPGCITVALTHCRCHMLAIIYL